MKKLYIILYALILIIIPVYATKYFNYEFDYDVTKICPNCSYYISCESNSMSPTFDCNDTLIASEPNSREDIKIGDIISYRGTKEQLEGFNENVKYVVHRVVGTDYKGCYITKGDSNYVKDNFHPCFYDIQFKIVGVIYQ